MSKEYIAIDKNTFPTPFAINPSDYARGWNTCLNAVLRHKVVDVAPVVHGEWREVTEAIGAVSLECIKCSACDQKWIMDEHYDLMFYKEQWTHCPFCGAKMDGGKK